ncbi:MAG: hypothetical protein Unbinned1007contig1000_14 [Prokaryotic dsDNA virus sp.]|nr:MAG: hypothetical protein Unbinned1007contig1000_14 [Prokaryotic dsDNA virus sp.]|tara:strand:+ start:608 stop:772 length:165 start_codon:yes stop_codon:yes gene_type:complete
MKLDTNKIVRFIAFLTLTVLSLNVSTMLGHGYHAEEEIQIEQRQELTEDEHTHY